MYHHYYSSSSNKTLTSIRYAKNRRQKARTVSDRVGARRSYRCETGHLSNISISITVYIGIVGSADTYVYHALTLTRVADRILHCCHQLTAVERHLYQREKTTRATYCIHKEHLTFPLRTTNKTTTTKMSIEVTGPIAVFLASRYDKKRLRRKYDVTITAPSTRQFVLPRRILGNGYLLETRSSL